MCVDTFMLDQDIILLSFFFYYGCGQNNLNTSMNFKFQTDITRAIISSCLFHEDDHILCTVQMLGGK